MTARELFTLVAGLAGGLALFMYGMSTMSGGLTKLAGGKLESTLSKITANRVTAYLFGVVVTALVQSSSASTVMVVGLVNSGIMKLSQAVNIILGANLGTTFTAWLLSLNSISSDNFFLQLLKPKSFTPFLALLGIIFLMFSQSDKKKNLGTILLGFSILMYGMDFMSSAVSPLKDVPQFQAALVRFNNPIIGFIAGILFTMMVQSSAATIGVVQALALSVSITYGMGMPIVIGAEVGTCITAILSSFGANKNGKRAALMHLYFNVIKAVSFMIIFYSINAFVHFEFLEHQAGMVGIASIHTLVNLVATPLMLPFSGLLVKLAYKTIPIDEKEKEQEESDTVLTALDVRFLSNPPFALEQARIASNDMAAYAKEALFKAMSLFENYDEELADEVVALEEKVDRYEDQIGSYLIKLSPHHLSTEDSHTLSILLHCISDFERISDHALNVQQIARRMHEDKREFSTKAKQELTVFTAAVQDIVNTSVQVFQNNDLQLARTIEPLEEVIDGLHMEVKRRHIRRLRKGKCTIELGFDLSDLGTDYERISDHCSNIAVCMLQVNEDGFDTHEYLEMIRAEKNQQFEDAVTLYESKYRLPVMKKSEMEEEDELETSFMEDHPVLVNTGAFDDPEASPIIQRRLRLEEQDEELQRKKQEKREQVKDALKKEKKKSDKDKKKSKEKDKKDKDKKDKKKKKKKD